MGLLESPTHRKGLLCYWAQHCKVSFKAAALNAASHWLKLEVAINSWYVFLQDPIQSPSKRDRLSSGQFGVEVHPRKAEVIWAILSEAFVQISWYLSKVGQKISPCPIFVQILSIKYMGIGSKTTVRLLSKICHFPSSKPFSSPIYQFDLPRNIFLPFFKFAWIYLKGWLPGQILLSCSESG